MKTLNLEITTQSPLLLAAGPPAGNLTNTLDHIPGAVLLGMLAHRYLVDQGADAVFDKMFIDGGVIFDHAYIDGALPIPQSARTCKYFGGFFEPGETHGVLDLALASDAEVRCPNKPEKCKHPIDYFSGYYHQDMVADADKWTQREVKRRVITRTAIENAFGGAASGKLYSLEVIEEGQTFKTQLTITQSELVAPLEKLVDNGLEACIGKGRSRGLGWVNVRKCDPFGLNLDPAETRAPCFKNMDGKPLLAVTLLSDALFCDDYLRDLTLPDIDHFSTVDGITISQWEKHASAAYADTRIVAGFQGHPWHLPREPRLAVSAGSVVLFVARDGLQPSCPRGDGLIRIGERIAEGYGRALLWSPFHTRFKPGKEAVS